MEIDACDDAQNDCRRPGAPASQHTIARGPVLTNLLDVGGYLQDAVHGLFRLDHGAVAARQLDVPWHEPDPVRLCATVP